MLTTTDATDAVRRDLECLGAGPVRVGAPLAAYATWRIGGPADVLIEPDGVESLGRVIRFLHAAQVRWFPIGGGSNLLFDDAGYRGVIVRLGPRMARFRIDGDMIAAEAGKALCWLARSAAAAGLAGLEHAVGIPGSLGGLVAMNGGSERQCIGDVLTEITVFTQQGERLILRPQECRFAHRRSRFLETREVVAHAVLRLPRADATAVRRRCLELLRIRRAKFPLDLPNCGSVFFCTAEIHERFGPPGRIVESVGAKGWRCGDAEVSPRHANFIVNRGAASAADVLALIRRVRLAIRERYGLWMPCEVRLLDAHGQLVRPGE